MCGRYASTASRANLLEQFDVDEDNAAELKGPDYNVAPTKVAPVVITRAPVDGLKDADPVRQLRLFKWGLLPNYRRQPPMLGVPSPFDRLSGWQDVIMVSRGRAV